MKKSVIGCAVVSSLMLLGSTAFAATAKKPLPKNDFDYNFVELQYFSQNLDKFDCSQHGLMATGSVELNAEFFARAGLADVNGNKGCGSETVNIGVGYRTLLNSDVSVYGALSYEETSPDHGDKDSGLVAALGFRTYLNDQLEGNVEVAHHTAFDGSTDLTGGVVYWFDPRFAATGSVTFSSDANSFAFGVRMKF